MMPVWWMDILLYYYTITHYVNCQWGGGWVEFSQVNNFLMQVIYDYYKLSRRQEGVCILRVRTPTKQIICLRLFAHVHYEE